MSVYYGIHDPPKLDTLPKKPSVAVLYTTCDDVNIDSLKYLFNQTYGCIDFYLLDDSKKDENKTIIDRYSDSAVIVRRKSTKGRKAGNLNNWLRRYGRNYSFFVILDNDSFIGPDFVQKMIQYALHPENKNVAAFQSVIEIKNPKSHFSRAINTEKKKGNRIALRLYNPLGFYFGWGHNVLYRTPAVLKTGMFNEAFAGEDIELGLRLLENRHHLKIVNILSHEGINNNILRYSIREGRICQSNLQVLFAKRWSISVPSYFFLCMLNINTFSIPFIILMNAIFLSNAITLNFGPNFAFMYLEYYAKDYFLFNILVFCLYLVFPILLDILIFRPHPHQCNPTINHIMNKIRLLAYHLGLHFFLFGRLIDFLIKRKVIFYVTNSKNKLPGGLTVLYEVSTIFYVFFSLLVLAISRDLFLIFSVWFVSFILLALINVWVRYNS